MSGLTKLRVKALKMLLKDYEKLLQKARKKREKELNPLQGTEKLSEDDLAEMYGWGNITWEQYQAALETLGDSNDKVEVISITSEYIRMLMAEIRNTQTEIIELEEELGIKRVIETREERRKRLGLEPK